VNNNVDTRKNLKVHKQDVSSLGWRTAGDQLIIYSHRVAIVGAGGAGGAAAEVAARNGFDVTIADPDTFDETNLNRQIGAYRDTLGQNKAKAISELVKRIRGKDADVRVFEEGLTYENVGQILKHASVVLDAIDIARPDLSIILGRKARKAGLPMFMGIEKGYGCELTVFEPDADDSGTVEHFFGIEVDAPVSRDLQIDVTQYLTRIPSYTPPGMLEAFTAGKLSSTPALAQGGLILSGSIMTAIDRYVLGNASDYPQIIYPYIYCFDPVDGMDSVHADQRQKHLEASMSRASSNKIGNGFSLPGEYTVVE